MSSLLPRASANAAEVDYLILALLLASCLVLALVFGLVLIYASKYRADARVDRGKPGQKTWRLEISWTIATFVVFFGLFLWGADLYIRLFQPPRDALQIYVVGKQWMWKVEHQSGQREINALHLPIGRAIQLVLTSEDVIHDFSVPAFRIKHDVLPGRYETLWFQVEKAGVYHLFCTQFCGEGHASMIGEIVAMSPLDFEDWLGQTASGSGAHESMAAAGEVLFTRFGCSGCHGKGGVGGKQSETGIDAPPLAGLYGEKVTLESGAVVTVDDSFIRDCIMSPEKQRVAGYPPIMPSFAGQLEEEKLLRVIAYIKSLKPTESR